jgi:predicted TIM-barrel fold metal-dependent hydrolase
VGFLEAGCGWLPYWLFRLDEEYQQLAGEVEGAVTMAPSAYFRRQCFAAFEPGEPGLAQVVRYVGEESLVFGTDFPHLDHREDVTEGALALRGVVSAEALGKMMGGNAERLYGAL